MKFAYIGLVALLFTMASCTEKKDTFVAPPNNNTGKDNTTNTYKGKAKAIFDKIIAKYTVSGKDYLAENYPRQSGDPSVAYAWPYSGVFTASNVLRQLGYNNDTLNRVANGMSKYFDAGRTPAAFQSYPQDYGGGDRFYDDNATIGLDYVEAYQVTQKAEYLNKAEQALTFDFTGESNDCGGGLFWVEQYRTDFNNDNCVKAACATGFSCGLAADLYLITHKQNYLDYSKRLYAWIKNKLQDPADKLIWNDMRPRDNGVNTTKWTYNTGIMIRNAVLLYKATNDAQYLTDAKQMAIAANAGFMRDVYGKKFLPGHDTWFNVILLRGYLSLYEYDKSVETYINIFIQNADHAWTSARTQEGFFYEDWAGINPGRSYWLLNQAAMVELYGRISKFKNE